MTKADIAPKVQFRHNRAQTANYQHAITTEKHYCVSAKSEPELIGISLTEGFSFKDTDMMLGVTRRFRSH